MKELERRSYTFEIRAEQNEDNGSIITGRPIVYSARTDIGPFDEIIEPGALYATDLTDVRLLVNHDTKMIPLARSRRNNGNSTMLLTVDALGLLIERANLDTENNATARALYSAVQRGDLSGMSMMFSVESDRWDGLDTEHPTRHILRIGSVVELSACTFPAYEQTEIYSRSKEALESARTALENARQQNVRTSPEGDAAVLELLKAKIDLL